MQISFKMKNRQKLLTQIVWRASMILFPKSALLVLIVYWNFANIYLKIILFYFNTIILKVIRIMFLRSATLGPGNQSIFLSVLRDGEKLFETTVVLKTVD